ncbi:MAG TPA: type II CAAX endopeptidase family protein [Candidatus Acidoferrales bacterium]|nr:type II CAAX endopeptidase family protein [Candidatus Acidoferrales bacterium]
MNLEENNPPPDQPLEPGDAPSRPPEPALLKTDQQLQRVPPTEPQVSLPPATVLPEDIRVPWGWIDLLLFVVLALAGTFLFSILLAIGFALFGVPLSRLQKPGSAEGLFVVISQGILFFVLLGYLFLQTRVRFHAPFWRTLGWRPLQTHRVRGAWAYLGLIVSGLSLALLVQVGSAIFGTKTQLPMEQLFQDRRTAMLLVLMAVLLAPVVEETIFRGYLYPLIARTFGITTGIAATGILFGLLHAPQLWGGWVQIGLLILVGIVFTYVRAVTRTVLGSYLLHVSYNSFISIAFLVGTHGLRVLHPGP